MLKGSTLVRKGVPGGVVVIPQQHKFPGVVFLYSVFFAWPLLSALARRLRLHRIHTWMDRAKRLRTNSQPFSSARRPHAPHPHPHPNPTPTTSPPHPPPPHQVFLVTAGCYWARLDATGGYWCDWALLGVFGWYWALLMCFCVLLGVPGSCWVLLGVTG